MSYVFWNQDSEQHVQPPGNYRDYLEAISTVAGRPAHQIGRTLDFGCNRAWACGLFEDYYGVDSSEVAIQTARRYWSKKLITSGRTSMDPIQRFVHLEAEAQSLPFENAIFDLILVKDVLEHLEKPVAALKDFHRILKPKGWVFLSTPDAQPWVWNDPTHLRPYPRAAHHALANLTGFRVAAQGYESIAPGTQWIARSLGRGRTPLLLRALTRFIPIWPRNTWSILQKPAFF